MLNSELLKEITKTVIIYMPHTFTADWGISLMTFDFGGEEYALTYD